MYNNKFKYVYEKSDDRVIVPVSSQEKFIYGRWVRGGAQCPTDAYRQILKHIMAAMAAATLLFLNVNFVHVLLTSCERVGGGV